MYHMVGDCPAGTRLKNLWVSAADFRRQMEYLKRRGYRALTLSELRDAELGRCPMPERPVLITFDDGFANSYELAYPVLKELGLKGNIFLVYEKIEGDSSWGCPGEPVIPMLSWAQIREMQESGVVEFGSHTMRHRNLAEISPEDARWELTESKARLEEKLGREMAGFAYPYGAGTDRPELRRLAREAGYRYDFGVKRGISPLPWDPDAEAFRRLPVHRADTMLDFHLNMTRGRARLGRRFWE